jgi:hypothetical protein
MSHGLPFGGGRHHFRLLMSFKMAMSSIVSASSFFSLLQVSGCVSPLCVSLGLADLKSTEFQPGRALSCGL